DHEPPTRRRPFVAASAGAVAGCSLTAATLTLARRPTPRATRSAREIFSRSAISPTRSGPRAPLVGVGDARRPGPAAVRCSLSVGLLRLLGSGPRLRDAGREHEVLAQRMALEPVRQQQRRQLTVSAEPDPEHLVRLALVPAGARVDVTHAGDL